MNKNSQTIPRRQFVKLATCSAVAVPFASALPAFAGGHLPKLDESNPQAAALGYKHDSNAVDGDKFPNHNPAQQCVGCNLYKGKDGAEWGECSIFPGQEVAAAGWCSAFVPRT